MSAVTGLHMNTAAETAERIANRLRRAAAELAACSDSARLDAELLLAKVLGRSRAGLIVGADELLTPAQARAYDALLRRRCAGAPVAYLTGSREFWSLEFTVTPAVLVPRPETEALVEVALEHLPGDRSCAVLDLGTGSGAVAIAIAAERPLARVTATDLSDEALSVASLNAEKLGQPRIDWRSGNWFAAVPGLRFDAILANPPYVAAQDAALHALRAEPLLALTPGETGLEAIAVIIAGAAQHLLGGGLLALEHGSTQAGDVAALLRRHAFGHIRMRTDAAGLARVSYGTIQSPP